MACVSALSVTLAPGQIASRSASFVTELAGVIEQVQQQVEQLWRERHHRVAADHAIRGPVD